MVFKITDFNGKIYCFKGPKIAGPACYVKANGPKGGTNFLN